MARLYANENFPLPAVEELRRLGHDVLTTQDAGKGGQAVPDEEILAFSIAENRTLLRPELSGQLVRVQRPNRG